MSQSDDVKWALLDLIKLLDNIYGRQFPVFHKELARIAGTLGVELPPPLNGPLRVEDEAEV